jgi:hypothetical protein
VRQAAACDALAQLGVPFEVDIVSAHRTPAKLAECVAVARARVICVCGFDHRPAQSNRGATRWTGGDAKQRLAVVAARRRVALS